MNTKTNQERIEDLHYYWVMGKYDNSQGELDIDSILVDFYATLEAKDEQARQEKIELSCEHCGGYYDTCKSCD